MMQANTVGNDLAPAEWMLIPVFCNRTGYTEKAVRRKIQDGVWLRGKHYKKAPDGHVTMNIQEYYRWVEQAE
jgi:hypothetical protein